MTIAIVGYGRMGKTIEALALQQGHQVSYRISSSNAADIQLITPDNTDVAVEFTHPDVGMANVSQLLRQGVATVCGTTGWLEHYPIVAALSKTEHVSFLVASNFSVGVHITFAVNKYLAGLMSKHHEYTASIHETHHTGKKDAPSGTAITLADGILQHHNKYTTWSKGTTQESSMLAVTSDRIDPAPGTHAITYRSSIDEITLTHTAHSRSGFATGALLAAAFLHSQPIGIYTMQDVLQLPSL